MLLCMIEQCKETHPPPLTTQLVQILRFVLTLIQIQSQI